MCGNEVIQQSIEQSTMRVASVEEVFGVKIDEIGVKALVRRFFTMSKQGLTRSGRKRRCLSFLLGQRE